MNKLIPLKIIFLSFLLVCCSSKKSEVSAQSTDNSEASEAKVTIVEYSDYQCPACAHYHPIVKQLKNHYGDKLKVEYRYFPLNIHQYAALAARAAEAARMQGEFLPMHNMLFENQESWANSGNPQAEFIGYARELGLDVDKFKEDLNSAEVQKTVMEEKKAGQNKGVRSTPTFFINGTLVNQKPQNYKDFKFMVDLYMKDGE